ncbi:GNAT family N-acetyltransferase [Hydrogenophaga sp. SNF1]|uniref:GNAT family N-acetyltransferase n=1 Tax=Hydrogenophaga borbori TaxID=2294117 RepID=A0A372EHJ1_9BURK|nr:MULTISPECIES: GNAT family N-acetyltransferase [Hydrogenophaga]RFP77922.1 GNAT family N-acetyltransferase [Hydrogenophaga borbori]WQB83088.1 GNAT family N-acetyltransferase [Hydrogenophaga sp. SNF1]
MPIRRLTSDDAPAYRELRLRALREHPQAFTSDWEEASARPLEESRQRLGSGEVPFWGAFDDGGALVGMVGLDCPSRAKQRHQGTVVAMYVAREAAGRGWGRGLLRALMAHAASIGRTDLVLTVTEGNASAIRLYQEAGFVAFGTEPRAIVVDGRLHAKVHMHRRLA